MSVIEIIQELPLLSPQERRDVRRRLTEIEEVNEDVLACDAAALEGALMLDELKAADEQGKAR
jgi:flagellar motor switch protein FliG